MAPDLSAVSNSTMARPRAATTAPAMASQSPTPRQPVHGPHTSATLPPGSPPLGTGDYGITSTAQGPLRHPQPLTPSDLHLVLEKEQEAMVNRLTRELSILRQQTASVASTGSSTSTFNEADGTRASPTLSSSTPSHSARRNRSNSSLSSHTSANQGQQSASVTGIAPSREIPYRPADHSRTVRSREPSLTSRRPSIGSLSSFSHNNSNIYPHRNSVSQSQLGHSPGGSLSRFEEATHHRLEVEYMKRENEQLRRRVRDLEQTLKRQKEDSVSEASATPSERIIGA
ncbi:hypothetical protein N7489_010150 [Penicillium chrysogenum]|uniref:Uncharacterized protein n=1 Tax=Penicillium chrysogenum TaxID=5076 RepID=A0ABQ8WUH2_PENCH|nr:uncharacterized protein N7489_010150 [Penicillium chrysogenum]KAJ5229442.1 hypothetical protein N7489_010150 [Penicillium chrysogenum]KAJ5258847.1 hypothetical protein N7524_010403 [Penicillium chrysogenum]KAJ5282675.1 hypothetical protein N7505_000655 [Penicillium chrysogenum]KAJ6169318.1 hypothetical protein N7497_002161 [Penicillium chrysogenum]